MLWRGCRVGLAAAIVLSAAALGAARSASADGTTPTTMFALVGSQPTSPPVPPSFLGMSVEFQALDTYSGRNPTAIDPVVAQLIRNLSPDRPPVLRIGGHSADTSWWPTRGIHPGKGVSYRLTRGWAAGVRALAGALGAKLILGLNMAAGQPALAAAEARALLHEIGAQSVGAFEIGNEPDQYGQIAWYHDAAGRAHLARGPFWSLEQFIRQFSQWRARLGNFLIAGPTFANLPWMTGLRPFLAAEPVGLVTFHRYPLRGCLVGPDSPSYPTIDHLLSDYASGQMAQAIEPYVQLTHAAGRQFRIDELNSVACSGRRGVSDTFASALWALDTLFNLASVGVDGVNVHTLPGAAYELFTIEHPGGRWNARVHPEYYALLMFESAAPTGSRLLPVSGVSGQVKAWATLAPDGTKRVVLINKDLTKQHLVIVRPPGSPSQGTLEWLRAPSVAATSGVTLGGQTFGAATSSGSLPGPPQRELITGVYGYYGIYIPPASAALLTFR